MFLQTPTLFLWYFIQSVKIFFFVVATPSELRSLDLYDQLTSLPKHSSDPEPSSFALDEVHPTPIGAPELSTSNYKARADVKAKGKMTRKLRGGGEDEQAEDGKAQMSKKEMGRMKVKMKVLEREKALAEAQAGEREKVGVGVVEVEMEMGTKMNTERKGKENMVRKRGDDGEEGVEMKRARVDDQEEYMDQS